VTAVNLRFMWVACDETVTATNLSLIVRKLVWALVILHGGSVGPLSRTTAGPGRGRRPSSARIGGES
jgi:hypothetical protein